LLTVGDVGQADGYFLCQVFIRQLPHLVHDGAKMT